MVELSDKIGLGFLMGYVEKELKLEKWVVSVDIR